VFRAQLELLKNRAVCLVAKTKCPVRGAKKYFDKMSECDRRISIAGSSCITPPFSFRATAVVDSDGAPMPVAGGFVRLLARSFLHADFLGKLRGSAVSSSLSAHGQILGSLNGGRHQLGCIASFGDASGLKGL
jgi:hypothetical protein